MQYVRRTQFGGGEENVFYADVFVLAKRPALCLHEIPNIWVLTILGFQRKHLDFQNPKFPIQIPVESAILEDTVL